MHQLARSGFLTASRHARAQFPLPSVLHGVVESDKSSSSPDPATVAAVDRCEPVRQSRSLTDSPPAGTRAITRLTRDSAPILALANRHRPLPRDYAPPRRIRSCAAQAQAA